MDKKQSFPSGMRKLMDNIKGMVDDIYQSTHMTSAMNKKDIEIVRNKLNTTVNNLSLNNKETLGTSLTSLISRNFSSKDIEDKKVVKNIEDLFSDEQSLQGIAYLLENNKNIIDFDNEIDIILKYYTTLNETIELKKDTVLSADNNSKDYLNFTLCNQIDNDDNFENNIKDLKHKYNLVDEFDQIYDDIAKYGEAFYYIVPYKKAFAKLLNSQKSKDINNMAGISFANESSVFVNEDTNLTGIIEASIDSSGEFSCGKNHIEKFDFTGNMKSLCDIKFELYTNGKLNSSILENNMIEEKTTKLNRIIKRDKVMSLNADNIEVPDGVIDRDKTKEVSDDDIKVKGAIFKKLKRENIIPIYIDKTCLGYYYIECDYDKFLTSTRNNLNNPLLSKKKGFRNMEDEVKERQKEQMLNKLSSTISKFIDVNFINNNQDMADQIYMILNHNELNNNKKLAKMKITYLPPEDVEHLYFKLDPITHRGISDLQKSLIAAKLYICLYVTNALAILTRGYDKRVYYVKQSVDTNIAQSLMNVMNQIKRGNFGAREISSIKNILGVTGKFQDLVIPMTSTGEAPVQAEVMSGQDINTQEEFMARLDQMAIEGQDMPYEYVQSRHQTDFALRLTMSNSKVLRNSFKRQAIIEIFGSRIGTKLYNYEYETNSEIKLTLPPPTLLAIANANQLIQNVEENVEKIIQMEVDEDADPKFIRIFKKKLMRHYLSTYLDTANIDKIKQESQLEFDRDKNTDQNM